MDWDRLEGDWKQLRGKAKEKWGRLTDDDLTAISGRRAQLEGKIQERYGYAKSQARKEIEDWYRSTVRTEIQSLASSVGHIANKQIGRAHRIGSPNGPTSRKIALGAWWCPVGGCRTRAAWPLLGPGPGAVGLNKLVGQRQVSAAGRRPGTQQENERRAGKNQRRLHSRSNFVRRQLQILFR